MTRRLGLLALAVALAAPASAAAPRPRAAPTGAVQRVVQGEKQDQQPVQIEATTLEVRDRKKMATFSGNVQVVQGDTTMKCQKLVVFYGAPEGAAKSRGTGRPAPRQQQQPGMPQNAQNIRRIEARGGVTVVTKDQSASGDLGIYDLRTKTITLTGNVVVSQGKNVLHGDRVIVDTETGNARVESRASARNRVRALIMPGKSANGTPTNIMSFGPARTN